MADDRRVTRRGDRGALSREAATPLVCLLTLAALLACTPPSETQRLGAPVAVASATGTELPFEGCAGDGSALAVFDAFWTELDRHYAVFDLRLRDRSWLEVGREGCAGLSRDSSDEELYAILLDMARTLDDGHVNLVAPALGRDEDAWVSVYPHGTEMAQLVGNVEARYLDGALSHADHPWFAWGRIGDLGYLSVTLFEALSESVLEEDDTAAAQRTMARVMAELGDVAGMIVDIRANEGGWDEVQLEVARWFTGERTLAYWKTRRAGPEHDDFGDWEEVWVEASRNGAFAGPVVLLTSGWTFSAAETFALSMRVRPNVTLLGEPTSGHFSDLQKATLPNGWEYTYSAERYRAADGEIYEARGVPVDVLVPFDVAAFAAGRDVMLEAALDRIAPH